MSHWKPGDVLTCRGEIGIVTRTSGAVDDRNLYIEFASGKCLVPEELDADARPLVRIDPESEADVTRLADALVANHTDHRYGGHQDWLSVQAALREFASPTPRIEEPLGLGAVVEDAEGNLWVRTDRAAPWSPIRGIGGVRAIRRLWSEVSAVRVLSEGVL